MYRRKLIFWSACTGMLLFGTSIIALGSIAPDLTGKLNLDEISSGTLFSIMPIGILAGSMLFGPIADRFGYKFLLAFSCMMLFVGFEGLAFAPSVSIIKIFVFWQASAEVLSMGQPMHLWQISAKIIKVRT